MTRPPHVVMVSWRDPRHPRSGGAERYTRIALRGLVQRGATVSWLAPAVEGLPVLERLDGINLVRIGHGAGHVVAAAQYVRRHRHEVDLVIDQMNGYPMLAPLWYAGPRMLLIHQLARGVWFHHLPFPAATVGFLLEPIVLGWYRRTPAITVSNDTARDLRRLGFDRVEVIENALDVPQAFVPLAPRRPPPKPTFVALGRLVPSKRLEHAVAAFQRLHASCPSASLIVMGAGGGKYAQSLHEICRGTPGARLVRDASEQEKWRTLAHATAIIATSVREGWGIAVSEAHAVGTPSVAYDVPGLRESTRHGENGLVCEPTPYAAADAMATLIDEPDTWQRLSANARSGAAGLTEERLQRSFAIAVDRILLAHGAPGLAAPIRVSGSPAR